MSGIIPPSLDDLSAYSRFVQRIRRRYAAELSILSVGQPSRSLLEACLGALSQRHVLPDALRILRQLLVERLAKLDCGQHITLTHVTQAMTDLAELSLDAAYNAVIQQLDAQHGQALAPTGERASLWIIGMGKLGARELNVSSDIDLIYVYDHDGQTAGLADGRGRISNQEYFAKAVKLMYSLIGETTEHGFVFRMDLALRPNGNSGPSALSLEALQEYFWVQGREWERFAWLKSRVVAPAASQTSALRLCDAVLPFVFRRYLDYNVFESLRVLHQQIRQHSAKRHAGRPERANDVKLSRGGIREIEFTVQLLQVVRGGQYPELRTRATLSALERLSTAKLMPVETAQELSAAYVFLRQVEHRIQYLDDQQTHALPSQDEDLHWLALTLGFGDASDFLSQLDAHRERVAQEFDRLLSQTSAPAKDAPTTGCKTCGQAAQPQCLDFESLLPCLDVGLQPYVLAWSEHPRIVNLREDAKLRLIRLIQRTQFLVCEGQASLVAAQRWFDWMEPLLRRESYLAMLTERPKIHEQLLRLLGTARWPARYVLQHPSVIDELASSDMLSERFDAQAFAIELESRRKALISSGQADEENLLNLLRRAHHSETFRTLARDVEGRLRVEQVADDLSALADTLLNITCRWLWQNFKQRHRDEAQLAVVAYGKLGGKELGYGSDLDIVFVFEDDHEQAGEIYAAFVRRLINWLTVKTGEGDMYEIDTALRPNGNSGLLVTSLQAYADYQTQRGSNTAWTWEHQAMTRARCCLGSPALQQQFEVIRKAVIHAPRDKTALAQEIISMRQKLRAARPVKAGLFDFKHSPGGMVDVEFAVQYLVLAYSASHAGLSDNVGNIALLQRAQKCGLLPAGVGDAAADAYRELRKIQHQARLDEQPTQVDAARCLREQTAVLSLWQSVFGAQP